MQCVHEFPLSLKANTVKIVFPFLNSFLFLSFLTVPNCCLFTLGFIHTLFWGFLHPDMAGKGKQTLKKNLIVFID